MRTFIKRATKDSDQLHDFWRHKCVYFISHPSEYMSHVLSIDIISGNVACWWNSFIIEEQ